MDAVYILGKGSLANNLELVYSIRSLLSNVLDIDNVYVVGEKPQGLPGVIHIEASDLHTRPWRNVYYKTLLACDIDELSDEFFFMNDDFFITSPLLATEFPFYCLKNSNGGNCGVHSFHVHCPIVYKKQWYKKMPLPLNDKGNLSPRTFYGNFYRARPVAISDLIIRDSATDVEFDSQIIGKDFFSIGNELMLNPVFLKWLDSLFPKPSRLESV
jgi:hypothetical protein